MFPKARTSIKAAYEAGVKIAVGTDAPAIPHGKNADELVALVDWGMPAAAVLRAATVIAAELINAPTAAGSPRAASPTSSRCPAIHCGHHRYTERAVCHERREGLE